MNKGILLAGLAVAIYAIQKSSQNGSPNASSGRSHQQKLNDLMYRSHSTSEMNEKFKMMSPAEIDAAWQFSFVYFNRKDEMPYRLYTDLREIDRKYGIAFPMW